MLRRKFFLFTSSLPLLGNAQSRKFSIRAEPGHFEASTIGPPSSITSIRGTLLITEFNPSGQWPTAAYMGVHQGPNRNESVQVLAIRNRPSDDYMVVGFRHIAGGHAIEVRSIQNVPLNSVVSVHIEFHEGMAKLSANDGPPFAVHTALQLVAPYVSVSSGTAEFEVDA